MAVLTGKRKNAPKRERDISIPEKVESVNSEDNSQYEKSKTILQAKARLYDKMTSGEVEGKMSIVLKACGFLFSLETSHFGIKCATAESIY